MLDTNDEYLTGSEVDRRYKRSPQTRQRWSERPGDGFSTADEESKTNCSTAKASSKRSTAG